MWVLDRPSRWYQSSRSRQDGYLEVDTAQRAQKSQSWPEDRPAQRVTYDINRDGPEVYDLADQEAVSREEAQASLAGALPKSACFRPQVSFPRRGEIQGSIGGRQPSKCCLGPMIKEELDLADELPPSNGSQPEVILTCIPESGCVKRNSSKHSCSPSAPEVCGSEDDHDWGASNSREATAAGEAHSETDNEDDELASEVHSDSAAYSRQTSSSGASRQETGFATAREDSLISMKSVDESVARSLELGLFEEYVARLTPRERSSDIDEPLIDLDSFKECGPSFTQASIRSEDDYDITELFGPSFISCGSRAVTPRLDALTDAVIFDTSFPRGPDFALDRICVDDSDELPKTGSAVEPELVPPEPPEVNFRGMPLIFRAALHLAKMDRLPTNFRFGAASAEDHRELGESSLAASCGGGDEASRSDASSSDDEMPPCDFLTSRSCRSQSQSFLDPGSGTSPEQNVPVRSRTATPRDCVTETSSPSNFLSHRENEHAPHLDRESGLAGESYCRQMHSEDNGVQDVASESEHFVPSEPLEFARRMTPQFGAAQTLLEQPSSDACMPLLRGYVVKLAPLEDESSDDEAPSATDIPPMIDIVDVGACCQQQSMSAQPSMMSAQSSMMSAQSSMLERVVSNGEQSGAFSMPPVSPIAGATDDGHCSDGGSGSECSMPVLVRRQNGSHSDFRSDDGTGTHYSCDDETSDTHSDISSDEHASDTDSSSDDGSVDGDNISNYGLPQYSLPSAPRPANIPELWQLKPGVTVELRDLKSAKRLNGKRGILQSWDPVLEKIAVLMFTSRERKFVKAERVFLVDSNAASSFSPRREAQRRQRSEPFKALVNRAFESWSSGGLWRCVGLAPGQHGHQHARLLSCVGLASAQHNRRRRRGVKQATGPVRRGGFYGV